MNRKSRGRWATTLAVLGLGTMVRAAEIQLPPETGVFKQDNGAEIANGQCLICHSVEYVSTQPLMDRSFWKASIMKMQQKYGAPIPDAQVEPLADYLARNYGAVTNHAAVAAAPEKHPNSQINSSGNPAIGDGPQLALKYGCLGCHATQTKLVGPSYREIAARYRNDPEAASKIDQQIHKGGSGKWGPIVMPPFPQISATETKTLSEWILGAK